MEIRQPGALIRLGFKSPARVHTGTTLYLWTVLGLISLCNFRDPAGPQLVLTELSKSGVIHLGGLNP